MPRRSRSSPGSRARRRPASSSRGAGVETLGQAHTVLFDKTGTLTVGVPDVQEIVTLDGLRTGEALRLAASVDRLSAHVLGQALIRAAYDAGLALTPATAVVEEPGQGIVGDVDGHRVAVGSRAFLTAQGYDAADVAGASLAVASTPSSRPKTSFNWSAACAATRRWRPS